MLLFICFSCKADDPGRDADFKSFTFAGVVEGSVSIHPADRVITAEATPKTDLGNIVPVFVLSKGASTTVDGKSQTSGKTRNDFYSSVEYAVSSEDAQTVNTWTVSITKECPDGTVTSIAVIRQPDKKKYQVGEKFDPSGMIVAATYSNNCTAPVPVTDDMLSYSFLRDGTDNNTVTITCAGKTASVTGITISGYTSAEPNSRYIGGRWFYDSDITGIIEIRFSANELSFAYLYGYGVKISPIIWIPVVNPNPATKGRFSSGYLIIGNVSESTHPQYKKGDQYPSINEVHAFYLYEEYPGEQWAGLCEILEQGYDEQQHLYLTRRFY